MISEYFKNLSSKIMPCPGGIGIREYDCLVIIHASK